MSRIYFHTPSAQAEVRGSERAYFGHGLARSALLGALGLDAPPIVSYQRDHARAVARLVRRGDGSAVATDDDALRFLPTTLAVAMCGERFELGGRSIAVWECGLNTLLASGSDPTVLAARLHGQCEIHAYVEGPNRAWLAEIVERGRASGIYRPDAGWESVVDLLRERSDEPAVTSYSVCDPFPNAGVAKEAGLWAPGPGHVGVYPDDYETEQYRGKPWWDGDEWYDLTPDEQWRLGMEALRRQTGLEMSPDRWQWPTFHFGEPITAFHVNEHAHQMASA